LATRARKRDDARKRNTVNQSSAKSFCVPLETHTKENPFPVS